jgi:LacI family transcriptional regulator
MKDVARLAGVSQTTVSFVINETPNGDIPDETKRRVMEAVKKLGYRPNAMAQGLRRQRTNTIGFITDEIASTPYAGQIVEGAQDAAWDHDKILLLVNTKGNVAIENAAIEMLLKRRVDGVIYATMYHRPVTPPQALREVPAVLLDCFANDRFTQVVRKKPAAGGGPPNTQKGTGGAFINPARSGNFGRLQGHRALERMGFLM